MIVLDLADLTLPTLPERLFGREAPLALEVGFGGGRFLTHLASTHPEWNVLGAELSLGSVARTFKRVRRANHRHVRLYKGHARFLVRNVVPPHSLHRVYVNFPDPWPKKRHQDRRLLQASFFRLLSTRLGEQGALSFTTDHADYFAFAMAEAQTTGLYDIDVRPPPPAALQTKYARKWQAQEKTIQHAIFRKVAEDDADFKPTIETYDTMHHAILGGPLPTIETFDKQVYAFDGGHVIVLDAFRPVQDDGYVFLIRIEEEELTQEVLIEARPTDEDTIFVGIKLFSQPLSTRGTREAVHVVTRWLEHQGMDTIHRSY